MVQFTAGFLEMLRGRLSLSSLIAPAVKLTRRGREYVGLCPFHKEKTGSFTVNDDKGFYHCFGCGAHGDIVSWMMDYEHLSYPEAVKALAQKAGVPLPEVSPKERQAEQSKKGLLEAMECACQFFEKCLYDKELGARARAYLQKRGLTPTTAKVFRLGYAPGRAALCDHLKQKGFPLDVCAKAGMVVYDANKKTYRDYFFQRLMFPILSKNGKVIAFGGRIMGTGEPKYLNSPETLLFHKGSEVYGLKQALNGIHHQKRVVLVEGYMDVISLHQAGFDCAVAPLGTALTEEQLALLWQQVPEPVICFDGDGAGQHAAVRALKRALPLLAPGKSLKFLRLPDGLDPDDIIQKKSPEFFEKLLTENPVSFLDMLWQTFFGTENLNTPEQVALVEKELLEAVAQIKNLEIKKLYTQEINRRLFGYKKGKKFPVHKSKTPIVAPGAALFDVKTLLAYIWAYPQIGQKYVEELIQLPVDKAVKDLIGKAVSLLMEQPNAVDLTDVAPDIFKPDIRRLKEEIQPAEKVEQVVQNLLASITKTVLKAKMASLMAIYDQTHDPKILAELQEIKQRLTA